MFGLTSFSLYRNCEGPGRILAVLCLWELQKRFFLPPSLPTLPPMVYKGLAGRAVLIFAVSYLFLLPISSISYPCLTFFPVLLYFSTSCDFLPSFLLCLLSLCSHDPFILLLTLSCVFIFVFVSLVMRSLVSLSFLRGFGFLKQNKQPLKPTPLPPSPPPPPFFCPPLGLMSHIKLVPGWRRLGYNSDLVRVALSSLTRTFTRVIADARGVW